MDRAAELSVVTAVGASGDFRGFYEAESPRLLRALYLLTGDREEAEDLLQESMARACERWERIRVMESPGGYVYRTAVNLNRNRIRRLARRPRRLLAAAHESTEDVDARNDLLRALATLPRGQRAALILVEWWGMETREAASVLGIKEASVRSRIHRAKLALRPKLGGADV